MYKEVVYLDTSIYNYIIHIMLIGDFDVFVLALAFLSIDEVFSTSSHSIIS